MTSKEKILQRCRKNPVKKFDMPDLTKLDPLTYDDTKKAFLDMCATVGTKVIELEMGDDLDQVIRREFPDARKIASNLPDVTIANINPDAVQDPKELDGTDVGVIPAAFGVAENGCIWVPQTMVQKAVCFISENLVVVMHRDAVVNNMHDAYKHIVFNDYGFGTFMSGPSKTADIAQVLVVGAQAARSLTLILNP